MSSNLRVATVPLNVLRFLTEECRLQRDVGPDGVYRYALAWNWLRKHNTINVTVQDIMKLGALIDPRNANGWRNVPIVNPRPFLAADLIPRAMESFCEAVNEGRLDPSAAYVEFETIHPFVDGNGRAGALLWNWMRKRMDSPTLPPDNWIQGAAS